jgi:hypothetical protein
VSNSGLVQDRLSITFEVPLIHLIIIDVLLESWCSVQGVTCKERDYHKTCISKIVVTNRYHPTYL